MLEEVLVVLSQALVRTTPTGRIQHVAFTFQKDNLLKQQDLGVSPRLTLDVRSI